MGSTPSQTNTGPWAPAQPYIKNTFQQAQGNYNTGVGYKPTPFNDLFTPYSGQTNSAISGMFGYGQQGDPLVGQSQNALAGIFGSGGGIGTQGQLQNLYNNSGNQAFGQALDTQAGHLTDDINREFSGLGRTGSVAQSGTIADQVGQARNQALASQWNQNVANQSGILGQIGNVEGQNVQNMFNAVSAAPGAWQQGLLPFQAEAQAGSAIDQQRQLAAQARAQRFQSTSQAPVNRLNQYSQLVGGPGQGSQSTYQAGSSPLGGALGGAALGGSMFGLPGALGGGLLGLGANLFNG